MWKEHAIEVLKKSNLKLTLQRLKLLEILENEGYRHPTINELHEIIKMDFPTISISTLYSNLLILKGLNLIELFSLEGETRVELNTLPHINIIEGKIIKDFEDTDLIKDIEKKVGKRIKFLNLFIEDIKKE